MIILRWTLQHHVIKNKSYKEDQNIYYPVAATSCFINTSKHKTWLLYYPVSYFANKQVLSDIMYFKVVETMKHTFLQKLEKIFLGTQASSLLFTI